MAISQPVAIKEPRDYHLRANFLAEDMGLEEVRSVQTLKFQGGKAPSTFVPSTVPKLMPEISHKINRIFLRLILQLKSHRSSLPRTGYS
jgi:hypothetical protein